MVVMLSLDLNKALKPWLEFVPFVTSVMSTLRLFHASVKKFCICLDSGLRRAGKFALQLTILYKPLYVTSVIALSVGWES